MDTAWNLACKALSIFADRISMDLTTSGPANRLLVLRQAAAAPGLISGCIAVDQ
jgi:hypothetical protein